MSNEDVLEWYEQSKPTLMIVSTLNFIDLNDELQPEKSTVEVEIYGEISHLVEHLATIKLRLTEVDIQD